ncbi:hypothetical protein HanRHA438_Chr07g0294911 [Helianthus annuus]|nr:hypothetical protein HanRHA438_Chr07g0294911 [Helianthus annuus]
MGAGISTGGLSTAKGLSASSAAALGSERSWKSSSSVLVVSEVCTSLSVIITSFFTIAKGSKVSVTSVSEEEVVPSCNTNTHTCTNNQSHSQINTLVTS